MNNLFKDVKPPVLGANGGLKFNIGSTDGASKPFSFGSSNFGSAASSNSQPASSALPIFGSKPTTSAAPIFGNNTSIFGSNKNESDVKTKFNSNPISAFGITSEPTKSEILKTEDSISTTLFGKPASEVPGIFRNSAKSTKLDDNNSKETTNGIFANQVEDKPSGFTFSMKSNDNGY